MEESQFEYLVEALTPRILKEDKNMRECMVYLVLHYLASGETFQLSEFQFLIRQKTISCIVTDACRAIFVILRPCYGNKPRNTGKCWKLLRNSTDNMTSRMASALLMENIL